MKQTILSICAACALFMSCNNGNNDHGGDGGHGNHNPNGDTSTSQSVTTAEANNMIASYLNSVNYQAEDTELHCWIVNADSLRSYLNDSSKGKITNIKIMLAHTQKWINSGCGNQNCQYTSGELTVIIAGYDKSNNYVYMNGNRVMDRGQPCPSYCPKTGTASSDFFTTAN